MKAHILFRFPYFLPNVLLLLQDAITFRHPFSSKQRQFLRLSLFLTILTVLRTTGQVFCRLLLYRDLSDLFFMMRLGLRVWGRKITEVKYHPPYIKSRGWYHHPDSPLLLALMAWLRRYSQFSTPGGCFLPLSMPFSLERSHYVQLHWRSGVPSFLSTPTPRFPAFQTNQLSANPDWGWEPSAMTQSLSLLPGPPQAFPSLLLRAAALSLGVVT